MCDTITECLSIGRVVEKWLLVLAEVLLQDTQRRDASTNQQPRHRLPTELGRLFLTDQRTLDKLNLPVIAKPNSPWTIRYLLFSFVHFIPAAVTCITQSSLSSVCCLLFTRAVVKSSSFISLHSYGAHLGRFPNPILAADRLSTLPDTRRVSVLLHPSDFALS